MQKRKPIFSNSGVPIYHELEIHNVIPEFLKTQDGNPLYSFYKMNLYKFKNLKWALYENKVGKWVFKEVEV